VLSTQKMFAYLLRGLEVCPLTKLSIVAQILLWCFF